VVRAAPHWDRGQAEQHARQLLAPYLARRPLAGEEQVLAYLEDIVGTLVPDRRDAALAIAAHIPALLMSGLPEGMAADPGRGQLDRLATATVNLAVASLRTARDPLPLGAFCRSGEAPLTQWRRLTALWQAYLAVDDWDRVLSSVILSEVADPRATEPEPTDPEARESATEADADPDAELEGLDWEDTQYELSCWDAAGSDVPDLGSIFADPGLRRLIQTGWLNGDHQLRAAASVWAFAAYGHEYDLARPANVGRLIAIALFNLLLVPSPSAAIRLAIEELGADSARDLDLLVGGPVNWPDEMLLLVADQLIAVGRDIESVRALIAVVDELDKRGSAAQARKLLRLMPANAMTQALSVADLAAIVLLSRRHQMPELLSRADSGNWLAKELLDWLSIEDIAWIIQSRSVPSADQERLRGLVRVDPRFRRAADAATELLAE
jgi:hypothetical protein